MAHMMRTLASFCHSLDCETSSVRCNVLESLPTAVAELKMSAKLWNQISCHLNSDCLAARV